MILHLLFSNYNRTFSSDMERKYLVKNSLMSKQYFFKAIQISTVFNPFKSKENLAIPRSFKFMRICYNLICDRDRAWIIACTHFACVWQWFSIAWFSWYNWNEHSFASSSLQRAFNNILSFCVLFNYKNHPAGLSVHVAGIAVAASISTPPKASVGGQPSNLRA